jgi:hypothetical protein
MDYASDTRGGNVSIMLDNIKFLLPKNGNSGWYNLDISNKNVLTCTL